MTYETGHLPPQEFGDGITRIDTGLHRPGMVACYLVVENGRAALIETGTWHSVPYVLEALEERSVSPDAVEFVIPTHIHLDHAGGAGALLQEFPGARLIVHPFGAKHMINPERITEAAIAVYGEATFLDHYHEIVPADPSRVVEAPDGFKIDLGGRKLVFVDTPGHAGHHFCVWDERTRGFFTGDTFGVSYRETDIGGRALVLPTTTPVQFKPDKWLESLDKLQRFDPRAVYLTHFGRLREVPSLMDDLREGIRAHHAIAAETRAAADPESAIRARLSQWFIGRLAAHGADRPAETFEQYLTLDLELNSQGLLAWQARNPR